jgi:hypothetical protein
MGGTNKFHETRCQQDKQHQQKEIRQSDRPTKKRKPGAASQKRGRQTQTPHCYNGQPALHLFAQPTAAEHSTASVSISRMPHAHDIQSLREAEHISSAAIDEALILLLRPRMPADTGLLLCTDSYFMTRTDMPTARAARSIPKARPKPEEFMITHPTFFSAMDSDIIKLTVPSTQLLVAANFCRFRSFNPSNCPITSLVGFGSQEAAKSPI